ncbi:hypothetical protein ACOME3_007161 [Neoechinorhynchus agilis]
MKYLDQQFILLIISVVSFGYFLRSLIARDSSYSGKNRPPMYGDFEAHRHWMEITNNLPVQDWYTQTKDNNLSYWGIDYPPVAAYHAYVVGRISTLVESDWTTLGSSTGYESNALTLFMRSSVFATELLFLLPGFCASIFTLAVMSKQMALYYSIPVALYMLVNAEFKSLFLSSISVLLTFGAIMSPYFGPESLKQVFNRMFPTERGLFEDKVANLWSTVNVFVKVRSIMSKQQQFIAATLTTLVTILPTIFAQSPRRNKRKNLLICSHLTALSFFLFSFQVHEKSILYATVPLCHGLVLSRLINRPKHPLFVFKGIKKAPQIS